jgi:hypothetical protein
MPVVRVAWPPGVRGQCAPGETLGKGRPWRTLPAATAAAKGPLLRWRVVVEFVLPHAVKVSEQSAATIAVRQRQARSAVTPVADVGPRLPMTVTLNSGYARQADSIHRSTG